MEKLIYLLWKKPEDTIEDFRRRLLDEQAEKLLAGGATRLSVEVADLGERAQGSPLFIGEGRTLSGAVSLWLECLDDRTSIETTLTSICSRKHGYLVTESIPRADHDRDWPDGETSPGVTVFTFFPKPDRVDDATFFERWHGSHTPLSLEIHPLWAYVRNAVARPVTDGAPPYRAIVVERFRELDDVLDPMRFFGSKDAIGRIMADLQTFVDMDQAHTALMTQTIVRS